MTPQMSLAAGERLGPYEILAPVGEGGMGQVYKARDTRLDRIVALKVSKREFTERFEREARAISALNHPHICQLYDVGPNYLVMEYIEGVPLKGPLPLDQALKYGAQICDALDAAHSKGITHRDLKPANILVTKSAGVKLLDFGLAKRKPISEGDETLTMALTGTGQIVGTLYYMSPEQLQGQDAGPATDIFSFGLVLYECLTGKRAFDGKTAASVIAAIMERPAPSVADVAPPALDRVLNRCLEKDPDKRWQSARDLKAVLGEIARQPKADDKKQSSAPLMLAWAVAPLLAVGLGFAGYRLATQEPPRLIKMSVVLPEKAVMSNEGSPIVSPNGKSIAFSASIDGKRQIWVRDLDSLTARPLPGTESDLPQPFWSPDSRWIAFLAEGKLKKIEVTGGPPLTVCDGSESNGASWGKDYILFGTPSGVFRVSPAGGEPTPITAVVPNKEILHGTPWFLPDGRHFLYTAFAGGSQQSVTYAGDVEATDPAKNRRQVLIGPAAVAYAQGYVLFLRDRTLMAQRFDTGSLAVQGDAAPVAEQVDTLFGAIPLIGVSQNGVLAYSSGATGNMQLTWYDRAGRPGSSVGTPGSGLSAAISPDGSAIAFDRGANVAGDVWLLDLARGRETRFTFGGGGNVYPIWSPDGRRIAYHALREGGGAVYLKFIGGSGQEQPLHKPLSWSRFPLDWSRDNQYIVEAVSDPKTKQDIWVAPLSKDQEPYPYLNSGFNETAAKVHPSGQWLAYVSDETGRNQVYVQAFPKPRGEIPVSTNGGDLPLWSRDGKELYYVAADRNLMAVEIKMTGNTIQPGAAKALFPVRLGRALGLGFAYDVGKDGRFLIPTPVAQSASVPFTVLLNWTAGLKK